MKKEDKWFIKMIALVVWFAAIMLFAVTHEVVLIGPYYAMTLLIFCILTIVEMVINVSAEEDEA